MSDDHNLHEDEEDINHDHARARFYQFLNERSPSRPVNFFSMQLNVGHFIAFGVFLITVVSPIMYNAFQSIWEMERDINDIKVEKIVEIKEDIKEIEKELKNYENDYLTLDNRVEDEEDASSDRLADVSRLTNKLSKLEEEIENVERSVRHLEIVTGVYQKRGM